MPDTPAKKTAAPRTRGTRGRPIEDTPLPDDPMPPISEHQMREMHGLLRSRLGFTDRADILDYLSTYLARDVTTRRDLTTLDAAKVIAHLTALPPGIGTSDQLAALREQFPPEAIGKLPRSTCRACSQSDRKRCEQHQWVTNCPVCHNSHSSATMHIDFVGHGDVTERLLRIDPYWTWEPCGVDQFGNPALDKDGNLWIRLTVLGVTRLGVGDAGNGKGSKERIGDALRNAAMRFGVALDLWVKGDREWHHAEKNEPEPHPDAAAPREPAPAWTGPSMGESLLRIDDLAAQVGKTREEVTAKYRADNGNLPVERLIEYGAPALAALADRIAAYVETLVATA